MKRGLSRKEAAKLIGWSPNSFEQLENGRCNFSEQRLRRILNAYGVSRENFEAIRVQPKLTLSKVCEEDLNDKTISRKPRRNHFKVVTKEVRIIRILRRRKGLTQLEASKLCGYCPGGFGHMEVGRIEMSRSRIDHILKCLGFSRAEFEKLLSAPTLRDDLLEETSGLLKELSDEALASANNIIKALLK